MNSVYRFICLSLSCLDKFEFHPFVYCDFSTSLSGPVAALATTIPHIVVIVLAYCT